MSFEEQISRFSSQWRSICRETLQTAWSHPDGWIFHKPVVESEGLSATEKTSYSLAITDPMDLRTVKQNLPLFPSPKDFEDDIRKIFENCLVFNAPGQDAYEMGLAVRGAFERKFSEKKSMIILAHEEAVKLGCRPNPGVWETWKYKSPQYDRGRVIQIPRPVGKPPAAWVFQETIKETSTITVGGQSIIAWRSELGGILLKIRSIPEAKWFQKPVFEYSSLPLSLVQAYYSRTPNPMDLACIAANIDHYPSPKEFRSDLDLIVSNCLAFNPPGDPVRDVGISFDLKVRQIWNEADDRVALLFKEAVSKGYHPEWVGGKVIVKLPRETSDVVMKEAATVLTWRERALIILENLKSAKSATGIRLGKLFSKPLHKYQISEEVKSAYYARITNPMDLGTISTNFHTYPSPHFLKSDIQLIFDNCRTFNQPGQEAFEAGRELENLFLRLWNGSGLDQEPKIDAQGWQGVKPEPYVVDEVAKKKRKTIENVVKKESDQRSLVIERLAQSSPAGMWLPQPPCISISIEPPKVENTKPLTQIALRHHFKSSIYKTSQDQSKVTNMPICSTVSLSVGPLNRRFLLSAINR